MKQQLTMEILHEDMESIKKDIAEIKSFLLQPKLKKEVIEKIKEARLRMQADYVKHDDIKKEFGIE